MALLDDVKANLILSHNEDDALLTRLLTAAVSYAEGYQHLTAGAYADEGDIPVTTRQAIIMLTSHLYESRDGSTGGFFSDNTQAAQQAWSTVNTLLQLERNWKV